MMPDIGKWNTMCNARSEISELTCFHSIEHTVPITFDDQAEHRSHMVSCYGSDDSGRGRRR